LTKYLIGTGGWAYFKVPNKPSLKAYSKVFNFVEVNHTFYDYPDVRTVERWRRTVPKTFNFAVRCHQDLTHRIGLKPVDEAYNVLTKMVAYCRVLDAPFLVFETPASYVFNHKEMEETKGFFSTVDLKGVRLVWEMRAPIAKEIPKLMLEFNIVHCVDLSRGTPIFWSDLVYTRLFGRGFHNIYQFTDEELVEIDQKILKSEAKTVAISFHGVRMIKDAFRLSEYKITGVFPQITPHIGVESVRDVLSEDSEFPSSRKLLIKRQGWKVVDLTADKRVHLSNLLKKIPEKTYNNLDEVIQSLEGHF
jgi:uncharacterized protein YecE (DUF72 family)